MSLENKVCRLNGEARRPAIDAPAGFTKARGMLDRAVLISLPIVVFGALVASQSVSSDLWRPAVMLLVIGVLVCVTGFFAAVRMPRGAVRIFKNGPLRFVARRMAPLIAIGMLLVLSAALLMVFEAATQGSHQTPGPSAWRYSEIALLCTGATGLGLSGFYTLRPLNGSVKLDMNGLVCQARWTLPIQVRWSDLAIVELAVVSSFRTIRLTDHGGRTHLIRPTMHGSDPVIVAEVIEYFRSHPAKRVTLNEPVDALSLVVELRPARQSA